MEEGVIIDMLPMQISIQKVGSNKMLPYKMANLVKKKKKDNIKSIFLISILVLFPHTYLNIIKTSLEKLIYKKKDKDPIGKCTF